MKKLIVFALTTCILISCRDDFNSHKEGNKSVITSKRDVTGNFTKIEVSEAIDVEIEQADNYSIEVEADSNLINDIKTTIVNGVLIINSDSDFENAEKLLVRVKIKQLNEIETTSASSVTGLNVFKGQKLNIIATSASEIDLEAEYDEIHAEATSTAEVTLKGKTFKLETSASSASQINASELLANEVFAQATSASETSVHAIVKLDAKASSAGSINSVKKPKELRKEETSGGEVSVD